MIPIMIGGDLHEAAKFVAIPRVGEYIEWGRDRAYCVKSVHYQPEYEGAMVIVEFTPPNVYAMIRGE